MKRGLTIGLVSNTKSEWSIPETLQKLGLIDYFRVLVTLIEVGWKK